MNTFKFFFEDVIGKYKTTDEVMYAILTNLDSALYQPGEAIIKHMAKVDELILITRDCGGSLLQHSQAGFSRGCACPAPGLASLWSSSMRDTSIYTGPSHG